LEASPRQIYDKLRNKVWPKDNDNMDVSIFGLSYNTEFRLNQDIYHMNIRQILDSKIYLVCKIGHKSFSSAISSF